MAKVKVSVAIFRKKLSLLMCPHLSSNFDITSYKYWYDKALNKFGFQHDRVKVKVAVTIFKNNFVIALVPLFLDRF